MPTPRTPSNQTLPPSPLQTSRSEPGNGLPRFPDRMCLGIENDVLEIKRFLRGMQKVEVLQRLGKKVTLHPVRTLLRHHALQLAVPFIQLAVALETVKKDLSHFKIPRLAGGLI